MGADHVSTLHRQASGAAVTMVADVHLARVQAIADGTPGVRATDDGFALIADPEVDAVVIASPDPTHVMPAVAAVNAGKPVLCEKALAPTVAECPQVVPAILAPAVPNAENPFPATHPSRSQVMPGFPASLPASRVPDSQDAPPLRWGIIGPGWIAERFTASVQRHTRQQIVAVGSRNPDRSAEFAARHGIERSHSSYEDLVADPGVDVVYVATPHNGHYPCARLALEAGKHALIEKPIGLNAAQAAEIAALATSQGVFCMEALWTFFLPKFDVIRQLLADGVLGQVRTVNADHGEHFTADHRIMVLSWRRSAARPGYLPGVVRHLGAGSTSERAG